MARWLASGEVPAIRVVEEIEQPLVVDEFRARPTGADCKQESRSKNS